MNRLALALVVVALPAPAAAQNIFTDAEVRLDDEAVELRLEARDALAEPRFQTTAGFVRIWFPAMASASLERDGDGRGVRQVRIRPGVDSSAVVVVRLERMRTLPQSAVTIVRDGSVARVRLDRAALGIPAPAPTAAPAEAPAEPAAPPVAAIEEELEAAAPEDAVTPEASPEPGPALSLLQSDAQPIRDEGMSTTSMLVLLVLLLGGAYLALLAWRGKLGKGRKRPDIEVVAQKRIGVRQQLVVVRALGQDHLLMVQAGNTERLVSVPSILDSLDPEGTPEGTDSTDDLLPFLRLGKGAGKDTKPPTMHRAAAPARKSAVEERPRFGADLMRAVAERGLRDSATLSGLGQPSDAVAGLLRLREKLGR